jgi:large conductance mechanosensitive channel
MFKDFKAFIMRGNVLDMAIGIIIGGAFGTIVKSLVDDVLMPPIGMALGHVDFTDRFILLKEGTTALPPGATLEQAKAAGAVTLNYGMFINAVYLVVRAANRLQGPAEAAPPTTKDCPYCATAIPLAAKKCPNCTTAL